MKMLIENMCLLHLLKTSVITFDFILLSVLPFQLKKLFQFIISKRNFSLKKILM